MTPPRARRQRGQALVEYLIVYPSLLLLVLGAVQFALLYHVKNTLQYATFMAARQGSLKNGDLNTIKDALAAGMTPLFTFKPDLVSLARGRAIAGIEVFNPLTASVTIVSPTSDAVSDFGGGTEIPNDNLMYRATDTGAKSGISIQDANLLKIRVTYCAKLVVPVVNWTIYALVNGITGVQGLATEFFADPVQTTIATTPNMCSQLKDRFGQIVNSVVGAGSMLGANLGFLQNALTAISNAVSGFSIPVLDWEIGGYRIPVTAEAVVRMQSPFRP